MRWTALLIVLAGAAACGQEVAGPRTTKIEVRETAGLARQAWPVEAVVRFEREALGSGDDVRVFRVRGNSREPAAFQVLAVTPQELTNSFSPVEQTFVRLMLLTDLEANGTARFEVALEGPRAGAEKKLQVTGSGVGKAIDTGAAKFELHGGSGQLMSFTPRQAAADRLVFVQQPELGPKPFHWNPDVWAPPAIWGHTSDWNRPVGFDAAQHDADAPPEGDAKSHPFFYREQSGPLVYRLARWGRMPFVPNVDTSVGYTFVAGQPVVWADSSLEFREGGQVHAVRNGELVFSRHQFDTAAWIDRRGEVHTRQIYDYNEPDRSFKTVAELPVDTPAVALANERKGYGIALVTLGLANHNPHTGEQALEQPHFTIRDYDEHGKGNPFNFHYFVRYLVYREGYGPTYVSEGSTYAANTAIVVFRVGGDGGQRYEDLKRWTQMLRRPPEVVVD